MRNGKQNECRIKKIVIAVDDKGINLTLEEADGLFTALGSLLGKNNTIVSLPVVIIKEKPYWEYPNNIWYGTRGDSSITHDPVYSSCKVIC
jgi:hypothetical protein